MTADRKSLIKTAIRGVMARSDAFHHEVLVSAVACRSRNVIDGGLGESEVLDLVIEMRKSGEIGGSTYLYLKTR
jgi:hypothetical protein